MKRKVAVSVITALLLGAVVGLSVLKPERLTAAHLEAERAIGEQLAEADLIEAREIEAAAALELATAVADEPDPNAFRVKFECSMGDFVIECHPRWAPIGAARFKEAVEAKVYDGARFFRVVPDFVAQFGIPGDPEVAAEWREKTIADEPAVKSNTRGMVTFAKSSSPDSRTTQLFISYGNNARLDGMGFSVFGEVIEGMDVVDKINSEYGQNPDQDEISKRGNAYLEEAFPRLDYIKSAKVMAKSDTS